MCHEAAVSIPSLAYWCHEHLVELTEWLIRERIHDKDFVFHFTGFVVSALCFDVNLSASANEKYIEEGLMVRISNRFSGG